MREGTKGHIDNEEEGEREGGIQERGRGGARGMDRLLRRKRRDRQIKFPNVCSCPLFTLFAFVSFLLASSLL